MHANLQILPPEDHEDLDKALALRLGAGELPAIARKLVNRARIAAILLPERLRVFDRLAFCPLAQAERIAAGHGMTE
jgi:hypothetical protein